MSVIHIIPVIWLCAVSVMGWRFYRKLKSQGINLRQAYEQAVKNAAIANAKPENIQLNLKKAKQSRQISHVFGLMGIVAIAGAIWMMLSTFQFVQQSQRASGQLIGFDSRRSASSYRHGRSRSSTTYAPRVRYISPQGAEIIFVSRVSSSQSLWPNVGSTVQVLYDPRWPSEARINCFAELWLMPLVLLIFGSVFLIFPVITWRMSRKSEDVVSLSTPPVPSQSPTDYNLPNIIK